jgi:hypothetical protein
MGSHRLGIGATLVVSLALPIAPAAAQAPGELQAHDLVIRAMEQSKDGHHEAAIALYLQAYDLVHLPMLLTSVGWEYEKLDDPIGALRYLCEYLAVEPDGSLAAYARTHAGEQQRKLGGDQAVCRPLRTEQAAAAIANAPIADQAKPMFTTMDRGRATRIAGITVGGLGLVGLGIGAAFGVAAQNVSNEIANHPKTTPWPENIGSLEASGKLDQTLEVGALIGGGALVLGGALVYYVGRSQEASAEHAQLTPVAAPGFGGVAFSGHW